MEQVTTLYGTISDDPRTECFFPDTGATLNIIGLEVAKDNGLKITKVTKEDCGGIMELPGYSGRVFHVHQTGYIWGQVKKDVCYGVKR